MNFSLDHNCKIKKPEDLRVQLTLFQPGGRLCPQHYCLPPPPQIWKLIYTSDKLNTYLVTYMSRSLEVHNSAEIFLKLIWFITKYYITQHYYVPSFLVLWSVLQLINTFFYYCPLKSTINGRFLEFNLACYF